MFTVGLGRRLSDLTMGIAMSGTSVDQREIVTGFVKSIQITQELKSIFIAEY